MIRIPYPHLLNPNTVRNRIHHPELNYHFHFKEYTTSKKRYSHWRLRTGHWLTYWRDVAPCSVLQTVQPLNSVQLVSDLAAEGDDLPNTEAVESGSSTGKATVEVMKSLFFTSEAVSSTSFSAETVASSFSALEADFGL
jgi:hypothetical protein